MITWTKKNVIDWFRIYKIKHGFFFNSIYFSLPWQTFFYQKIKKENIMIWQTASCKQEKKIYFPFSFLFCSFIKFYFHCMNFLWKEKYYYINIDFSELVERASNVICILKPHQLKYLNLNMRLFFTFCGFKKKTWLHTGR